MYILLINAETFRFFLDFRVIGIVFICFSNINYFCSAKTKVAFIMMYRLSGKSL